MFFSIIGLMFFGLLRILLIVLIVSSPSFGGSPAAPLHASPSTFLPALKKAQPQKVQAGIELLIKLELPGKEWKINEIAPSWLAIYDITQTNPHLIQEFGRAELNKGEVVVGPLRAGAKFRLQGSLYYCLRRKGALCRIQSHDQELNVVESGQTEVRLILNTN